jgi:DNA-binding protein HU-beta
LTCAAKTSCISRNFPDNARRWRLNRTELIDEVARRTGLSKVAAGDAVAAFTEAVTAALKAGDKVQVFGFGTFQPRTSKAGYRRNPRTQQLIAVPAKRRVHFAVAAALNDALNTKGKAPAGKKAAAKKSPAKKVAKKAVSKAAKTAKKR